MVPVAASTLGIVLLVLAAVVLLLAAGGYVAMGRRTGARDAGLRRELEDAERAFAQARAQDRGWDRDTLAEAAQQAALARFGDATVGPPLLIQVLDRPGTDADQAIFHVRTADGTEHRITLGRSGGEWGAQ